MASGNAERVVSRFELICTNGLFCGRKGMLKIFGFLTKKDGPTMQGFIDCYGGEHVPLIGGLMLVLTIYKGKNLAGERLIAEDREVDFDNRVRTKASVVEERDAPTILNSDIYTEGSGSRL